MANRDIRQSVIDMLGADHTALLIHDMQNDFCTPGGKVFDRAAKQPEKIRSTVTQVAACVELARQSHVPIVYLQNMHLPNAADVPPALLRHLLDNGLVNGPEEIPCIKGTWGHQIVDELRPLPDDIVIEKGAFNDFHNSMLDKVLRNHRIEAVVLTGISTHVGILATAFGLVDHGYHFLIPSECVSGNDPELEAAAMKLLTPHVVSLAAILERWTTHRRS